MHRFLTWARVSFRLQRLEILLLAAGVLVASGLMLWWAFDLAGIARAYPDCDYFDPSLDCQAAGRHFSETFSTAEIIIRNTWLAGFVIGLIMGVPLVAREVEHRTAQLAWTMGRSRLRWLTGRVAFAALVVVLLSGLLAVSTELLAAAMFPGIDLSRDFNLHGNRGPLIVGHAMLALGVGVLVGALLGRQLTALLLGMILVGALYGASYVLFPRWYEAEAVVTSQNEWLGGPLWIGSGIELASGERISYGEFYGGEGGMIELYQAEDGTYYGSQADLDARRDPMGRDYVLIIPGDRYNEIVVREAAIFTGAGLLLIGAAALVTRRRRPA